MAKKHPIEIFMPPNILKAKMGDGGLDRSAVERAEKAIHGLKGEFTAWVADDARRLSDARNAYVERSDDESLTDLYRAAHDLKGQAATFDFPLVSRVAASLCRLTDDANCGLASPIALIDAHVDAIKVIVRDDIKDPSNHTACMLAAELERQVSAVSAKHPAA